MKSTPKAPFCLKTATTIRQVLSIQRQERRYHWRRNVLLKVALSVIWYFAEVEMTQSGCQTKPHLYMPSLM